MLYGVSVVALPRIESLQKTLWTSRCGDMVELASVVAKKIKAANE